MLGVGAAFAPQHLRTVMGSRRRCYLSLHSRTPEFKA